MKNSRRFVAGMSCLAMTLCIITGCTKHQTIDDGGYTYDEALKELNAFNSELTADEIPATLDIYNTETQSATLADIDTFPITVKGNGAIDIEVAAATEMSSDAPDDWLNVVAGNFNKSNCQIKGKTVSVTIRRITSGEVITYMTEGDYRPDVYAPSSEAWGEMLSAKGIGAVKVADRIAGNTAGVLMEKKTYDEFISKYKEVTLSSVLDASLAGDLTFAYTNPYTSSTGLNILTGMLYAFDNNNPLSSTAQQKLLDYQKKSPPVAYTTSVLRDQASKGIIKAMVMEEQAYKNTPELKDYVYTPAGIRHDHPVYTFDYVSDEKQEAAKLFAEFCQNDESQALADKKGFNLHDDYQSQPNGLDGAGYISAQKIWKQSKDGGQPIIAVFVADISGSMAGEPINSLKESLISTSAYISSDNYIGLVSYSDNVHINLPIDEFDEEHRAYFSGAVKALDVEGNTATYDAVLVGLKMLIDKKEEIPNAKMMMFVLSDGAQNCGYSLDRISPIVGGLRIPVYTIGYNLDPGSHATTELERLSGINEASLINATSDDLINHMRNLFNVEL
ncbi:MAG: VWA domain-containing protein [Clostridia bacterium]|nr:VWA domain-containing protein [Clostridia bacterium]